MGTLFIPKLLYLSKHHIRCILLRMEVTNIIFNSIIGSLVLPLHGIKKSKPFVHFKSGLNQSFARGRKRHEDEAYIPYLIKERRKSKGFFPRRGEPFEVRFSSGQSYSMKVCQATGKALMTDPNKELGSWLLRDVLRIPHGIPATYEHLLAVGITSIRFDKYQDGSYELSPVQGD